MTENITFPELRWRTVITTYWEMCEKHKGENPQKNFGWGFVVVVVCLFVLVHLSNFISATTEIYSGKIYIKHQKGDSVGLQ